MKQQALSADEIVEALKNLPGWQHLGPRLAKKYQFADFQAAMRFMNTVAVAAENLGHHPEWKNVYNRVEVELTTHDLGNQIGPLDLKLAAAMEEAARN